MSFSAEYIEESIAILRALSHQRIEVLAVRLARVRDGDGRLFIAGNGGSAGHASHMAADFRKMCGFQAISLTDNVSELTARINDDGWDRTYADTLVDWRMDERDALIVLSVGGGDADQGVSVNITAAIDMAQRQGAFVAGIVGRDGGYTAKMADLAIIIPPFYAEHVTAHTEGITAEIWHLLAMHPLLKRRAPHWESLA